MLKSLFYLNLLLVVFFSYPNNASAKNYAFMLGLSDYDHPLLKGLKKPIIDVKSVAQKLHGRFAYEAHMILTRDEMGKLLPITKAQIETKWEGLLSKLKDGDVVLFYFAGHAIEVKGRNYLLTSQTEIIGEPPAINLIQKHALDLQKFLEQLAKRQKQKNILGHIHH